VVFSFFSFSDGWPFGFILAGFHNMLLPQGLSLHVVVAMLHGAATEAVLKWLVLAGSLLPHFAQILEISSL
jgi:hypothetical protein